MTQVIKKDGSIQDWDSSKILRAINLAATRSSESITSQLAESILAYVALNVTTNPVPVTQVHKLVENALMHHSLFDTAREYITYRQTHQPDLFRKREVYRPFEYPELHQYADAIRKSYWTHDEFDFTSDIQDFLVNMSPTEKEATRRTILAIAHVEATVKTFWARLGDRLPKPELAEVGITFGESECFDDQTEILTESGWKYFDTLTYSDKVAQYDTNTAQISYVTPTNIVVKPYSGVLHHYKGKSTDICVTPKHELLVRHPSSTQYIKAASESGKWGRNYYFPVSGKSSTLGSTFTANDAFLIALQADGSLFGNCPTGNGRRDFTFTLSKERKVAALTRILTSLNVDFKQKVLENSKTRIWGVLPSTIPDVATIKSFGWLNPSTCSYDYGRQFIAELGQWDSTVRDSNIAYYNSNVEAINKVQHLAVQSGFLANLSINRTKEASMQTLSPSNQPRLSAKDVYVLSLTDKTEKTYPHRTEVDYEGYVYCATVPTGAIVVRRNGASCIQGNCRHANAYAELLNILGLNDDFAVIAKVPVFKQRKQYMDHALSTKDGDDRDYLKSIMYFSLFIENVSLFSQFLIVMMINQKQGYLKGTSNVIASTSLEEQIHANFGIDIVNERRVESPSWFTSEWSDEINQFVTDSFQVESAIIDWIFEQGEIPAVSKAVVLEYIKSRFNKGLTSAGFEPLFQVNHQLLTETEFFDLQLATTTHVDFFHKRSSNYTKKAASYDADSLF